MLLIFLILLVSFPLGMRLAGERTQETPLGTIDFSLALHPWGAGELYVPLADWGVQVDLFDSPLLLKANPKALDRDNILLLAEGEAGMLRESEKAVLWGVGLLFLQNSITIMFFVFGIAFIIASLSTFPRKRFVLEAGASALGIMLLFFLLSLVTYSPRAIEEPKFYAKGSELKQLVQVVNREVNGDKGSYASEFERVLRGMGRFLSASEGITSTSEKRALLLSDLHSNALVLPSLENFSSDDPVFFVGDFAHQGNDAEALILSERVRKLGSQVVAVSGNHDSESLMLSLAREGVIVIGKRGRLKVDGGWEKGLIEVDKWKVAGYSDPLEWKGLNPEDPERAFSFQEISSDSLAREKVKLLSWWKSLPQKPDILLIHQESLAQFLASSLKNHPRELIILTGHTHNPALFRVGNVSVVNSGAAGAGGLFGLGSEEAEIASLHFNQSDLHLVDFIAVDPIKGSARAERISVKEEVCPESCLYEPNWGETVKLGGP